MRIIFVSDRLALSKSLTVSGGLVWSAILILVLCVVSAAIGGFRVASARYNALPEDIVKTWHEDLLGLDTSVSALRERAEREDRAYATRVATLQSRLLRMEAVGQRLVTAAKLDNGEFDFDTEPAIGGPFDPGMVTTEPRSELTRSLDELARQIEDREQQLEFIDILLVDRKLVSETAVTGRPVALGYISSGFGARTDPFHGTGAWHKGVDFTARPGTNVVAVAAGVVVWSGRDKDYGNQVEIRHSDGYVTRYAHNRENLVKAGEMVKKGQVIAHIGSSGRATGSHLHFEVLRDGAPVNPMQYINARASG